MDNRDGHETGTSEYLGQCDAWDEEDQRISKDTVVLSRLTNITKHRHREIQNQLKDLLGTRINPTRAPIRYESGEEVWHPVWYAGSAFQTGPGWPWHKLDPNLVTKME